MNNKQQPTRPLLAPSNESASNGTNPEEQVSFHAGQAHEPILYVYTRKNALADGRQIDVSKTAAEAGFEMPVFMTRRVYDDYVRGPEGPICQSERERLWDILKNLRSHMKRKRQEGRWLHFCVLVPDAALNLEVVDLIAQIGTMEVMEEDDPRPAITIASPY